MTEATTSESTTQAVEASGARGGALLVADGPCEELSARLEAAGLEVTCVATDDAARALEVAAPSLVLVAFGAREGEGALVGLARRLRAEPRTFALPVVFLYRADERTLRSAALHIGVDDYFARDSPAAEMRARLDALFWRAEAGRRAAPVVGEQRSEIDNFIYLLDAVSADARRGAKGAVALVEAHGEAAREGGDAEGALARAHGFLKLNLRRVDSVAFYGPTVLLVHLPRMDAREAQMALTSLEEEFTETSPDTEFVAGIASFPADGGEVERLIEKAEAALSVARNSPARVLVYEDGAAPTAPAAAAGREARAVGGAAAAGSPGAVAAEGRAAGGERRPAARGPSRSRRLLLTVSDAARMAQINLLMRSAGYEVRAAFDGQHALGLLRIDRPDLLVVDYELQGMDGIEMLRRLSKQSGGSVPLPALLLLPGGAENLRGEALEAGASGVVELPFDPVELLDALRNEVAGLE